MSALSERLERALRLEVTSLGDDCYRVTGGARSHVVQYLDAKPYASWCDCEERRFSGAACQHLLGVILQSRLPADLLPALRELIP